MPQPNKIPRPFADSGDKNSIPDSSGSIGFASWQEGFPAITSEPFAQGGVAPKRADFNGIFNALSAATVWNQQGGVYAYDNSTDYEVGNIVEYSDEIYLCLVANGPSSAIKAPSDISFWALIPTMKRTAFTLTPNTSTLTVTLSDQKNYIAGNVIQISGGFTITNISSAGWYSLATADISSVTKLKSAAIFFTQSERNVSGSAVALKSRDFQIDILGNNLRVLCYLVSADVGSSITFRFAKTLVGSL